MSEWEEGFYRAPNCGFLGEPEARDCQNGLFCACDEMLRELAEADGEEPEETPEAYELNLRIHAGLLTLVGDKWRTVEFTPDISEYREKNDGRADATRQ